MFVFGLSVLFHGFICLSLCQFYTIFYILITVVLYYILKSGSVVPPDLSFFFQDCIGYFESSVTLHKF